MSIAVFSFLGIIIGASLQYLLVVFLKDENIIERFRPKLMLTICAVSVKPRTSASVLRRRSCLHESLTRKPEYAYMDPTLSLSDLQISKEAVALLAMKINVKCFLTLFRQ